MKIDTITPKSSVIKELGRRLAHVRRQRGYTQAQLSNEAGLGVATLRRIEEGRDAQIGSWIKLLKALNMTSTVDSLVPEIFNSPMSEVKSARRRARKTRQSDQAALWGDEQE